MGRCRTIPKGRVAGRVQLADPCRLPGTLVPLYPTDCAIKLMMAHAALHSPGCQAGRIQLNPSLWLCICSTGCTILGPRILGEPSPAFNRALGTDRLTSQGKTSPPTGEQYGPWATLRALRALYANCAVFDTQPPALWGRFMKHRSHGLLLCAALYCTVATFGPRMWGL